MAALHVCVSPSNQASLVGLCRGHSARGAVPLAGGSGRGRKGRSQDKARETSRARHTRVVAAQGGQFATDREREDWMKRQQESGGGSAPAGGDEWRWTLNWSPIIPGMLVGSCPRSPEDIDRIADDGGATALVNLQSDTCFDALQIPFQDIRQRAVEKGVRLERVPIRDFDHGDQSFMLPQAVRMINLLLARGDTVYIHCTAGINRAPLAALGYLTFVQGMELNAALNLIKAARPIVNPYLDCWHTVRGRLLSGRHEEQVAVAAEIYNMRAQGNMQGDSSTDWKQAQATVVTRTFQQYLRVDLDKLESDEKLWEWQQRARVQQRQEAAAAAAAGAERQLKEWAEESKQLEAELSQLSLRTLRSQLQSLEASSKALRLEPLPVQLPLGPGPGQQQQEQPRQEPSLGPQQKQPRP